jgi:hypothetical protein
MQTDILGGDLFLSWLGEWCEDGMEPIVADHDMASEPPFLELALVPMTFRWSFWMPSSRVSSERGAPVAPRL